MLASRFLVAIVLCAQAAQSPGGLVNGSFEETDPEGAPIGWRVPTPDYRVETLTEDVHDGSRCAHLVPREGPRTSPFGNLMQSLDAAPFRSLPIRLSARVRVTGAGARAQMWLRVDRENQQVGLFDNMGDRPIHSTRWRECEITGSVDPDALRLNVGFMLIGEGELWVDGVELVAAGSAVEFVPAEPPRPLSDGGLANLRAYAELFGYVRHFHPSDQAAAADWNTLAVRGVRAVEGAATPAELARVLEAEFAPIAPAVRVFPAGTEPAPPETEPVPSGGWITHWEHLGFGQPGGVYTSERVRVAAAQRLPPEAPAPSRPYEAELAGGVRCIVPLALHGDAQGTLPRPGAPAPGGSALHRPSGDDRATRLACVVLAWNVFQHFYPYFDVTPVDWDRELDKALRSAATDADGRAFLDTLRRMVAALADGHGHVNHGSGVRVGALPLDWDWIEGRLVVTAVGSKSGPHPAPGDVVLSIDGVPAAEAIARLEGLISGATPQWIRHRALGELRLRSSLEPCALELARYPGEERVRVSVAAEAGRFEAPSTAGPAIAELEPGVWYVDLGRVTPADLDAALEGLADASGIVYDLRGYPAGLAPEQIFGHLIEEPVTSAQWHIPRVLRPNREQLAFERGGEWNLRPVEPYFHGKKAFLTGGGAISYAESCLGIVEHYRLAAIVGGPSAGTNGNVNPFALPGDYRISWTGMKVLKHDGSRHHGVGIRPTIPVERTRAGAAAGRDEILERGLAAVRP